jgi:hypothetical protein
MRLFKDENSVRETGQPRMDALGEKESVRSAVLLRLKRSPYRELRGIDCDFHEGVLSLRGRVPSFYLKQVAQTLITDVDRVVEINNRLEVFDT